jgi:serine/threonine protein kinase
LFQFFEDQNYLYLVMECATGGELFDRIQARVRYSELDAQIVVKQMLQAVQVLGLHATLFLSHLTS